MGGGRGQEGGGRRGQRNDHVKERGIVKKQQHK